MLGSAESMALVSSYKPLFSSKDFHQCDPSEHLCGPGNPPDNLAHRQGFRELCQENIAGVMGHDKRIVMDKPRHPGIGR